MDVTFNDGNKCPIIGFGTWQCTDEEVLKTALREALAAGYRHIDTAYNYKNEAVIGDVLEEFLQAGKIKREDLYITTKLPMIHNRPSDVEFSLDSSLKRLKLSYVDLYLDHFPVAFKNKGPDNTFPMENDKCLTDETDLEGVWQAMEEMVKKGKTKTIGVSNFNSKQIERICKIAKILPATNQVECHAYLPQKDLAEFCNKWKIVLTAYAPIGSPGRPQGIGGGDEEAILLNDPMVTELAQKYNKTAAQVLLRFLIQLGRIIIPKSVTPSRIRENFNVFDFTISEDDMAKFENLKSVRYFIIERLGKGHPEYPFNIPF